MSTKNFLEFTRFFRSYVHSTGKRIRPARPPSCLAGRRREQAGGAGRGAGGVSEYQATIVQTEPGRCNELNGCMDFGIQPDPVKLVYTEVNRKHWARHEERTYDW